MVKSKPSAQAAEEKFRLGLVAYGLGVILPVVWLLGVSLWNSPAALAPRRLGELALWVIVVAMVDLLPLPSWRGIHLGMAFPVLIAVGFLYPPASAALTAFVGSVDPREFRREISLLKALFNRSQIALAVFLGSWVFHGLATLKSGLSWQLLAATTATLADYIINISSVTFWHSILHRISPLEVMRRMRLGRLSDFLVNYLGLGVLGIVLAQLYVGVGFWAVPAFLTPLIFARQMFFRSRALEEAHKELQDREQVMRGLSDRMAEERQDERAQIAAYLHDDLAQLLFRLSLQVDIAKRHLKGGDVTTVEEELESIRETKNRTSEKIRALIRDLHRSPLGRAGLGEALESFTQDVGGGSGVRFTVDVADLQLPPAIQLLIYHMAREAVMNALKHSGAETILISLQPTDEGVELILRDDGIGFDTSQPGPDGHYGLTMMRERAQVAGGTYQLTSAPGEGTAIRVNWNQAWLQQEVATEEPEAAPQDAPVAETVHA